MTFDALAAIVMISGPGDTTEEVRAVEETINKWNRDHAEGERVVFIPQHYLTDTVPVLSKGVDGQTIINEQITDKADVVIALFKYRLGTPTPRNDYSGTVEEAEARSDTGNVHVYFWDGESVPTGILRDSRKLKDWTELGEYRATFHANESGLYSSYSSVESLSQSVERALWLDARKLKGSRGASSPASAQSAPAFDLEVSLEGELVWRAPEVPELIETLIKKDIDKEREWAQNRNSAEEAIARAMGRRPRSPKQNSEIELWTAETRAKMGSLDEKIAAAAGVPIAVSLATSRILKDLEVEFVFYGVRGLDPTEEKLSDIWEPLHVPESPDILFPFGSSFHNPPYNPLDSWWEADEDDVILTVRVDELRKQRKYYESDPVVVLMLPFTETGVNQIRYTWRASATNVDGELTAEGYIPVMKSAIESLREWYSQTD
ncbi:hypothetical protein GCM10022140_47530 [Rhodococcus aetherivorans]|uniref:hypothetical protein n=1 Tax=Rhodococcus aetherivorans TaxID=191292 RepID=UPI0004B5D602|nr:hypothetical protein [Rhodococcus aetherivorans]NGP28907.1 hypothetical protein [Rhodococcus aetherivorans]